MNTDEIIEEIRRKTKNKNILELIKCLDDFSLSPEDLEKKLIKAKKISFSKFHD